MLSAGLKCPKYLRKQEPGHNESKDWELLQLVIAANLLIVHKKSLVFAANSNTIQNKLIIYVAEYIDEHTEKKTQTFQRGLEFLLFTNNNSSCKCLGRNKFFCFNRIINIAQERLCNLSKI